MATEKERPDNNCCGYVAHTDDLSAKMSALASQHPDWREARLRQRAYVEVMIDNGRRHHGYDEPLLLQPT